MRTTKEQRQQRSTSPRQFLLTVAQDSSAGDFRLSPSRFSRITSRYTRPPRFSISSYAVARRASLAEDSMNTTTPLRSKSQTASTRSALEHLRSAMSSSSRHGPSSSLTTPSDVRYKKVTPQRGCLRLQSKSVVAPILLRLVPSALQSLFCETPLQRHPSRPPVRLE